jgi:ABC-type phosphate/phosphonate transport system substrate-binding protein
LPYRLCEVENDEINNIQDLKDKSSGAGAISMIMATRVQLYEMEAAGISYIMDPKQVAFTGNQADIVNGVLDGEFDVGFVRTDKIEGTKNSNGNPVDQDVFKIIEPNIYVLDDGNL